MDIVKRINDLLGFKDWSIHQLSLESDIPRSTLYRIMAHEVSPTFEQIEKICDGFNITIENFVNNNSLSADELILLKKYNEMDAKQKRILILIIDSIK